MTDVENVLVAALRLPVEARAAVAAELIESLDDPGQADEEVEAAWSEEPRRIPGGSDTYPRGGHRARQTQAWVQAARLRTLVHRFNPELKVEAFLLVVGEAAEAPLTLHRLA